MALISRWRSSVWAKHLLGWLLTALFLACLGLWAAWGWQWQNPLSVWWWQMIAGMSGVIWLFVYLLIGLKSLLALPWAPLAVARTTVREAVRMKVPVFCMLLLVLVVCGLPYYSQGEMLKYRIQSYMNYCLLLSYWLIALMTLVLACSTMAGEFEGRHFYITLVKPIARWQFLLGKWIGVMILTTAVMLVVAGGIYGYVRFYFANQQAMDDYDRQAVTNEVLVARQRVLPDYPRKDPKRLAESLKRQRPALVDWMGGLEAVEKKIRQWQTEGGTLEAEAQVNLALLKKEDLQQVEDRGESRVLRDLRKHMSIRARTLGPGQWGVFDFNDLHPRNKTDKVTVRYRFRYAKQLAAEEAMSIPAQLLWEIPNGLQRPDQTTALVPRTFKIPAGQINDEGHLRLKVRNRTRGHTVYFPLGIAGFGSHDPGLEIFYAVGSFEGNFIRAFLVIWIKMAFLAALGIWAASFLSFPIAMLLVIVLFVAAELGGVALKDPGLLLKRTRTEWGRMLGMAIGYLSWAVLTPIVQFSRNDPMQDLVAGRLFSWWRVLWVWLWIGLTWIGGLGLLAAWVFHRRELARVQV